MRLYVLHASVLCVPATTLNRSHACRPHDRAPTGATARGRGGGLDRWNHGLVQTGVHVGRAESRCCCRGCIYLSSFGCKSDGTQGCCQMLRGAMLETSGRVWMAFVHGTRPSPAARRPASARQSPVHVYVCLGDAPGATLRCEAFLCAQVEVRSGQPSEKSLALFSRVRHASRTQFRAQSEHAANRQTSRALTTRALWFEARARRRARARCVRVARQGVDSFHSRKGTRPGLCIANRRQRMPLLSCPVCSLAMHLRPAASEAQWQVSQPSGTEHTRNFDPA